MEIHTSVAQRRPAEHLRAALHVPRVRLQSGDVQRGLARYAAVRHSGARSDHLRAVVCAARPRRALSQFVNKTQHKLPIGGMGCGGGDFPCVPCPITSRSAEEAAQRLRQGEEVLDAPV